MKRAPWRQRARGLLRRTGPALKTAAWLIGLAALVFTFTHLRGVFPALGAALRWLLHPVVLVLLVAGVVLLRARRGADRGIR